MKALLMYPDRDFDAGRELPPQEPDLTADLELNVLLTAMAGGDEFLYAVARQGLYTGLTSPAEITYRQHVLADCVAHPDVTRDLYDLAVAGVSAERQVFGFLFRDSPATILHRSLQLMGLYVDHLHRLAGIAGEHAAGFARRASPGSSRCWPASSVTATSPSWRNASPSCSSGAAP